MGSSLIVPQLNEQLLVVRRFVQLQLHSTTRTQSEAFIASAFPGKEDGSSVDVITPYDKKDYKERYIEEKT